MGAFFSSLFSDKSKVQFAVIGIGLPFLFCLCLYGAATRHIDPIKQIVISYDEDDDFDLHTIVAIMDAQFNIGRVP